jgi:hypothetical protein
VNENAAKRAEIVQMVREYQSKITDWIKREAWNTDSDDDYEDSTEYKEALEYWNKFKQQEQVDYTVALAYARELFERYEKLDKSLDEKADSIVKYLGGGSALVTLGGLFAIKTDVWSNCLLGLVALACMIPSLVVALRAVSAAIRVRQPRASATMLPVKFAVDMAEFHKQKDNTELNLWLMLHPICEAYHFRTFRKSFLVKRAHSCYRWAIGLLLLPVIGMTITLFILTLTR